MSGTLRTEERNRRLGGVLSSLAVALGCALFLGGFIWAAFVYRPYTVPTGSMTPTIDAGDRVLAQRIDGSEVHRGDVVVFKDPSWGDLPLVKRVVAIGGDRVACCTDGKLTVNGKKIDEPYLAASEPASLMGIPSTTVPKGRLFVLGDERKGSLDSSVHLQDAGNGAVPRSTVAARVDAVAWPLRGMLDRPSGFASLRGGLSQPGPLVLMLGIMVAGAVLIFGGAAWGPLTSRRRRGPRRSSGREELAGVG